MMELWRAQKGFNLDAGFSPDSAPQKSLYFRNVLAFEVVSKKLANILKKSYSVNSFVQFLGWL